MDKKTLTSVLFMTLMVFVFLWIFKPKQDETRGQRPTTEQTTTDNVDQNVAVASLTPDEVARLAPTIRTYGKPVEGQTDVYELKNDAVDLKLATRDSVNDISGVVMVGEKPIDVKNVISNNMMDLTPEQAHEACNVLRGAISKVNKYKSFAPFVGGDNQDVVLENDQVRVTVGSNGAMIREVVLKKYKTETTEPATDIKMFTPQTGWYTLSFTTADQRIRTTDLNFRPTAVTDSSVVMSLPLGNGIEWNVTYTLRDNYLVDMQVNQKGMEAVIPTSTSTINFDWEMNLARNEKGRTFEERNSALMYKMVGEGPDELNSNKEDSKTLQGHTCWVAFKNQFFSAVVIPNQAFTLVDVWAQPSQKVNFVKEMAMTSTMPYSNVDGTPLSFTFFFGPNSYPLLSSLDDHITTANGGDLELNRLVPLGWGLFRWINQLITIPVFNFLSKFIHNYGIIILLLTLFIKLILFPFQYKSYMSQAKMRVLAPEIKEINDKYPGQENAMKRQQETMALYSKAGASPFSGCLPMLLQMPVYIAMFAFFPSAIELRGQSFLWAHDLSAPDSILTLPFTIPFYGDHVSLFCLLMTVVNIIYTHITMQSQPGGNQMPGMKWMMYLMPIMFLFFFNDYASGLSYYYFLSLLITIIQTWVCRRIIDEKKVRAQMLENAKKPKKQGGFMARLAEAQKRQEAMMREQARQNAKKKK